MTVSDLADLPVAQFDAALALLPWDWAGLTKSAREIVLFGSRATTAHGPQADWDLLVIGPAARSVSASRLDLVGLHPDDRWSERWLTSGLARHVAVHGRWLLGQPDWTSGVRPSDRAVEYCLHRARAAFGLANSRWHRLDEEARAAEIWQIRRRLQKIVIERSGEPMPVSAELDSRWQAQDPEHLLAVATELCSLLEAEPLRYHRVRGALFQRLGGPGPDDAMPHPPGAPPR